LFHVTCHSDPYLRISALLEARCGLGQVVQRDRLSAFLGARPAWEQTLLADRLTHAEEHDPLWQTLVEAMLVHETYFYRHEDQLAVFAQEIIPNLAHRCRADGRRLQVWCAGCSTGEEAYTLAFLLREAGCPAHILATDLSAESVTTARAGVYRRSRGLNSFRALPGNAWRNFDAVATQPETWTVSAAARQMVEFSVQNLMTPHPAGFSADLITCRNTLLYFGPSGLRQAEATLVAAARPGSVLLLGPAERLRYTDVFQPMTPSHPQILHWPL
jgi:chemotaxis protein methyltransferase CheR